MTEDWEKSTIFLTCFKFNLLSGIMNLQYHPRIDFSIPENMAETVQKLSHIRSFAILLLVRMQKQSLVHYLERVYIVIPNTWFHQ
jgi:hypothetical protein